MIPPIISTGGWMVLEDAQRARASHAPPRSPARASDSAPIPGPPGASMADGLASGSASAMGHGDVDAVSNSVGDACRNHTKAYQDCLSSHSSNVSKCQVFLDMVKECRRNSGSVTSA